MEKNTSQPTEKTAVTVTNTEVDELKKALAKEYRTDHLTLPVVAPAQNKERDKASDLERKILLDPNLNDDTVVDDAGTTLKEWRDQLQRGVMPKGASSGAKQGIGKHKIEVETVKGEEKVVITAPSKQEVVIAYPDLPEGKTPFGSELMHQTSPVSEDLDTTKTEGPNKPDSNK